MAREDNQALRRVLQALARRPGATLLSLALGLVVLLPLAVHYVIMLLLASLTYTGLLQFRGELGLSWLMSNGQVSIYPLTRFTSNGSCACVKL